MSIHLDLPTIIFPRYDDTTDTSFVIKVKDEKTKNRTETNQEVVTGVMKELKGNRYCPVRSFELMFHHLNKDNSNLWQAPYHSLNPEWQDQAVWYTKQSRGKVSNNHIFSFTMVRTSTTKRSSVPRFVSIEPKPPLHSYLTVIFLFFHSTFSSISYTCQ